MSELDRTERWLLDQLRFDRDAAPLVQAPDWLEWNRVVDLAEKHGSVGLLLACPAVAVLPPPVHAQLREIRFKIRSANALRYMGLEDWLERFEQAGIPTIVLKGAAVAIQVYEDIGLRAMTDIDLLVKRDDFERAEQLLRAAGFTRFRDLAGLEGKTIRTAALYQGRMPWHTVIDLHWHIVDSGFYVRQLSLDWLWSHTATVTMDRRTMRVLFPEAQLVHLSAHFVLHHASEGPWWLYDVAALIDKYNDTLEWEMALDAAERFELRHCMRTAILRACAVYGVSIPGWVSQRLTAWQAGTHERIAIALANPSAHPAAFLFDGWEQPGLVAKLRYWWRSLFPSKEFIRLRDPKDGDKSAPSLYLARWMRGLHRIPRALWATWQQLKSLPPSA